ncbi:hypothetical protein L7F22_064080 [Adiantum nelumboides]|nr:hypothetical protein [Adiantum nelumboides]
MYTGFPREDDFFQLDSDPHAILRMYGVFGTCSRSVPACFYVFLILSIWYQWQWGGVLSLTADKVALLAIKASIKTDPQALFADWREGVDHCKWRGVGCDASGRVVALNITGRGLDLTDTSTSCCGSFKLRLPCLANGQTVFQSGRPNEILDNSSFAGSTLRGTLSPAVGNLAELRVLSLPFNGFFGKIPNEVCFLKFLEHMDLQGNEFSGSLPSGFGKLSRLRTLNVAYNELQGIISQEISSCRNLEVLNMAGNRLTGAIPTFFKHMPNLRVVALSSNRLFGSVPLELISNCGRLEHLHLEDNFLYGKIPEGFGNCTLLQSMLLSSNALSGTIPADIGQLQELQVLDVSRNSLGGNIPSELANCSQLSILLLSNDLPFCQTPSVSEDGANSYQKGEYNYFTFIPTAIMGLSNLRLLWAPRAAAWGGPLSSRWGSSLEVLNLASNSLTGSIPTELVQCKRLLYLDLSNNKLEGSLPSLSVHCLIVFNVSGNALSGELPGKFSIDCPRATLLDSLPTAAKPLLVKNVSFATEALWAYFSSLYCGAILSRLPVWFLDQSRISVVHDMSVNNFTGTLQTVLIGDALLTRVPVYGFSVSDNQLTGTVSSSLFQSCQKLGAFSLKLSRNNFLGALPIDAISKCTSLKQFKAAGNQLNGIIPPGLGRLKHLVEIDLSSNQISGELPSEVGELQQLQYYILAKNNLTGVIPESYGELSSLLVLDFSGNNLTGSFPGTLGNLLNLTKLLLSKNYLSGFVPENFTRLKYLSVMDVASNNLSRSMRQAGSSGSVCTNMSADSNELPNSFALSTPAPSNQVDGEPYAGHVVVKKNSHPNAIMIAAITSGCAIAAVLIILLLLFYFSKQDNRVQVFHRQERRHLTMFHSFEFEVTYADVVAATGNFSLNNLIGTGGFGATYKAEISPGLLVAVKRLSSGRFQGTEQFEAEIRTLGRVQHPNLVTLIGYHASDNEKFLIYNFLPGGNLENLIHDPRRGSVSWRVRLRIALNIAQALAYLHDECTPRVLHRDIKPSNVLLDNNLNAILSDFGLARLLNASETHATTDVAGTFGYVAPEYVMMCRLSEKADVYSYGVVLLELLSGKKALDPYFSKYGNGFNIVQWAAQLYRKGKPLEILAPGLQEQCLQSELTEAVKLAVRCTMTSISVRPTMRQVVNILKAIG